MVSLYQQFLKEIADVKSFSKQTHIFFAEEAADAFYYVEAGEVRLYRSDSTGKEVEIRRVFSGDIFGEVFVFAGTHYPVSAVAVRDSRLWVIEKSAVFKAVQKNQDLALFFIQILAKRCLQLNQVIENIYLEEVPIRVARYFWRFLQENPHYIQEGKRASFQLRIPKKDLAVQLGTIPETLSRAFEKLHALNLIKVIGKTVVVLDVGRLKEFLG